MGIRKKRWLAAGFCGAALLAFVLYAGTKTGYLLPHGIQWQSKTLSRENPNIILENKMVTAAQGDSILWQNDPAWRVQDALWCDIDHDMQNELLLLCWKRGLYGDSRPFWVERDPPVWSQHIFIYEWEQGEIRPVWMASQLNRQVTGWTFTDTDRLILKEVNGKSTRWDWLSWGLSFLEECPEQLAAA